MLNSDCSMIVLILMQDRCTVCAERTIALEIVLEAPDGLRNHFGLTRWNSKWTWVMWNLVLVDLEIVLVSVCVERTIGSKIILDAPDGTPR
jgi:hypothetical protein